MIYNISFDICAGVITLLAIGGMLFNRDMERRSNRIFFIMISMHLISVIFDIWSSICNSYPMVYGMLMRDFTNYAFLGVHTSEAAIFCVFLLEQLGIAEGMKKWQRALIWLPEVLMVIVPLALNPFLREVFRYDADGFYMHGRAMPLLYIAAYVYMMACVALVARYRSVLTTFQRRAALALLLLSIVPMVIQSMWMPRQLIEMFFQTLGFCGYLQSVENIDESRHPVTHMLNRHALIRDFMKGFLNEDPVSVVILKISQAETLLLFSAEKSGFHYVRMSVAEWIRQNAKELGMKFYDCEKGIYVAMASDPDAAATCRKFADRAEIRFQKPWGSDAQPIRFPAQISIISLPDSDVTVNDFSYLITQPYFSRKEGIVYSETAGLLRLFHSGEAAGGQSTGIPAELQHSMDDFLSRVSKLSPAERKIFDLYVAGYEVNEIPNKLFISINTVKKHNKSIYRKLEVRSREEIRLYVDLFAQCERSGDFAKSVALVKKT